MAAGAIARISVPSDWVSAGSLRHFAQDDPLLDWLDHHGKAKGFVPDNERPGYDPRMDMLPFILRQGLLFEAGVMRLLEAKIPATRIVTPPGHGRARSAVDRDATLIAMRRGDPMIAQGVLWSESWGVYGIADLLIRADVLEGLFPDAFSAEAMGASLLPAPGLDSRLPHYRVIDIKFSGLDLLVKGHAGAGHAAVMPQVWLYNEALAEAQGYRPPSAYLLGRSWETSSARGSSCLDRLARVDVGALVGREKRPLEDLVREGLAWLRRVQVDGATWDVLPVPSVPELWPHARNTEDAPWHGAKREIAAQLDELTLLPGMNPTKRRQAHAIGITSWRQPNVAVSAALLGVTGDKARLCDAVLAANRGLGAATVLPAHIGGSGVAWRTPAPVELFVDFETVSNLADDFSRLPMKGGQPLIFQIGCGHYDAAGKWIFWQHTVDALSEAEEGRMIEAWVAHMNSVLNAYPGGATWSQTRLFHWSPAETSFLETAYNSARARHRARAGSPWAASHTGVPIHPGTPRHSGGASPSVFPADADWPDLPWFDFLVNVIRPAPVTIRGAFNFGLKSIAKSMHAAGLIETVWADGPADGLGAMVGAWAAAEEAQEKGVTIPQTDIMLGVSLYNGVDCKAMAETITWLRANR